jgi:hypothetical protein
MAALLPALPPFCPHHFDQSDAAFAATEKKRLTAGVAAPSSMLVQCYHKESISHILSLG